jgi:hypothetical protein
MRRARKSAPRARDLRELEEVTTQFVVAPISTVRPAVKPKTDDVVVDVTRTGPFKGLARLESSPDLNDDDWDEAGEPAQTTGVSDVVAELARLSDPARIPRLNADVVGLTRGLSQPEAFIASLVGTNLSIQAILDMSPMGEDETLRFLARLITDRVISL